MVKDSMLITKCSEDGGECGHKKFVNEGCESIICDNFGGGHSYGEVC